MSILKYTSVREIIGRVIDDVGGKLPSHYFDPMIEWTAQGMRMLETKYQLIEKSTGNYQDEETGEPQSNAIFTKNHVAPLPYDLMELIAVEDMYGERVREASAETDFTNLTDRYSTGRGLSQNARATNFQIDVFDHSGANPNAGPNQTVPWDGSDIVQADSGNTQIVYKIQGNMIQTSEDCVFIKLHYRTLLHDQEGFLMVPDVEEYKQALGFFILRQLIGAGFKHPVWNGPQGWSFYDKQWEKYAGRALGAVKYPTIDRAERIRTSFSERMIAPREAYDDFFTGKEQIQDIGNI